MHIRWSIAVCFLIAGLAAGCATRGPVVPQVPTVQVTQLDSLLFTPEVIKFQAKIMIKNRMAGGLKFEKVDFGADVQGKPIFTESFSQLKVMRAYDQQTITFPFQIALRDIKDRAVDILAEEGLRITFRGEVHPDGQYGFGSIPFSQTRTIPFPRVPTITVARTEGSPLKVFTVFLKIKNSNTFPLSLQSLDSYIEINGTRYQLLRTEGPLEIKPHAEELVALKMEQTTGSKMSMALNIVSSSSLQFAIGGDMKCGTPYGLVHLPLKLTSGQ
jgi:hypothetical protein